MSPLFSRRNRSGRAVACGSVQITLVGVNIPPGAMLMCCIVFWYPSLPSIAGNSLWTIRSGGRACCGVAGSMMGWFWILSVHLICGVAFIICGVLRTGGIVFMMQTKNFLCKKFCRKPGVERSVQKAARPLNSVWMGGPEEEQLGCSPKTEGCIL